MATLKDVTKKEYMKFITDNAEKPWVKDVEFWSDMKTISWTTPTGRLRARKHSDTRGNHSYEIMVA